jgi:Fe-S-cluster containining protein
MSDTGHHGGGPAAEYGLSFHAGYGCRESGACCTAGWPIPIETDRLTRAKSAIRSGLLTPPRGSDHPFVYPPDAPRETPALLGISDGACVFYRFSGSTRCELHRVSGHDALPLACRQFPRIALRDRRGVSVTLSHYCPTAAGLLQIDGTPHIVSSTPLSMATASLTGLDVRTGLPPALRPDMLMDWEGWWQWEAAAVELLAGEAEPADGLARLGTAVEAVRMWRPSDGHLSRRITLAFEQARASEVHAHGAPIFDGLLEAIPDDFHAPASAALARRGAPASVGVRRAFVVAHTFANWTAHLGEGLRTWLRSVEVAHALVVSGVSVRDADLLLRHLADPHALARVWSRAEGM